MNTVIEVFTKLISLLSYCPCNVCSKISEIEHFNIPLGFENTEKYVRYNLQFQKKRFYIYFICLNNNVPIFIFNSACNRRNFNSMPNAPRIPWNVHQFNTVFSTFNHYRILFFILFYDFVCVALHLLTHKSRKNPNDKNI